MMASPLGDTFDGEQMLHERFERSLEVFTRDIYPEAGDPVVCRPHQAFGTFDTDSHNCLGCNFADVTNWIYNHLNRFDQSGDVSESMSLISERHRRRAYEIFEIISLPQEYRGRHFEVFRDIHKLATFKHPKGFLLVHHPSHFIEGMPEFDRANALSSLTRPLSTTTTPVQTRTASCTPC